MPLFFLLIILCFCMLQNYIKLLICWGFRTKIKCCLTQNFVIFTIFRQNGVIFLIIWWLYDGRHTLYMAVGIHIVCRPSTARMATVVQRGLA